MALSPKDELLILTALTLKEKAPDEATFRAAMAEVEGVAAEMAAGQNKDLTAPTQAGKKAAAPPAVGPSPFRKG